MIKRWKRNIRRLIQSREWGMHQSWFQTRSTAQARRACVSIGTNNAYDYSILSATARALGNEHGPAAIHVARGRHNTNQVLFYADEQLCISQEGVSTYDRYVFFQSIASNWNNKTPQSPEITTSLTWYYLSMRLFCIDMKDPENVSFSLDLAHVIRTGFYAGLFTSSFQITLHLVDKAESVSSTSLAVPGAFCQRR